MPTLAPHGWSTGLRALIVLAAFALVTGCLYLAQAFVLPIAVSVLLAFLLTPVVAALQRWGLGRLLSVLVVVLLVFAVLAGIGVALGTRLNALGHELPRYRTNIREKIADVRWLGRGGAIEKVQETVESAAKEAEAEQPSPAPKRERPTPVVIERETAGSIWALPAALAPCADVVATSPMERAASAHFSPSTMYTVSAPARSGSRYSGSLPGGSPIAKPSGVGCAGRKHFSPGSSGVGVLIRTMTIAGEPSRFS